MTPIGREEAQRKAAEELLKPEYQQESFTDTLVRRFQQFLADLFDTATGGGLVGAIIATVAIVLILCVIAFLVFWYLRKTSGAKAAGSGELFGAVAMTAAEHRAEAERLAAENRWADAIRERLRAIARDLEDRALVDNLPGRTADELAAEAGKALPGFADDLATAARIFDEVTYGSVPGTPASYQVLGSLDDRIRVARPAPLPAGGGA